MKYDQKDDPVVSDAIKQLKESNGVSRGQFKNQLGMNLQDGLLCRGRKIVVPTSMRQEVMTLVHSEGHPGIDKTDLD